MSGQVVKRPRVERDLYEHAAFIARDKLEPALRLLEVAEEAFARLAAHPGIGLPWKSKVLQLRGMRYYPLPAPYRSYIVFYRELADKVEILAVLHGTRDLRAMADEEIQRG